MGLCVPAVPYLVELFEEESENKFHPSGTGESWRQVNSTKLATTVAASLLGISLISNHPVAGSIIVTHHRFSVFFPGRFIVYGPIKSTHNFSHGSASASLIGRCPYFFFVRLVI